MLYSFTDGETLGQLAAWNVMQHNHFSSRPVAGVVSSAQLHRPAYVGETLLLESWIDVLDETAVEYHSIARVGNERVFTIESALGPLLPMQDFISTESVRQQFAEIYHPTSMQLGDFANLPLQPEERIEFTTAVKPMVFDRILSFEPGVRLTAEKRITRAAAYFDDHFPGSQCYL